ncbi:glycosyltransferase [Microbacterium paludicola]|uniref:D-inositol 3-phosphate glycosyltransferase n=1 Tax=Microbacterium paludicola TaxID=300019 RepID=A0A4Y9FSN9_9MICO|nr:glycosyltransferase [Microbacterium paludicola]MBF0817038.1 glycosyltransferase [Microbacterium paludicola]TFU32233.1 glycosyltransferase [Microbacterium paludicola]
MHVVIFADQHVESLGGAQVSTRLQRRYLERAGHTVTIVAPRRHGARAVVNADDPAYLDLPSIPITLDREYSFTWPGRAADRAIDRGMTERLAPDVVHVQADFWGAFLGYRFAARHGLPVVHTMHNRVDVGIEATAPFPGLVLRALNGWRRAVLRGLPGGAATGADGWAYLRGLARGARAVTAPSSHFARRLEAHGVFDAVDVVWNGIDDEVFDRVRAEAPAERAPGPPRFVWLGRMSPEKRLLPFLEALAQAHVECEVELIGGGGQLAAARKLVDAHGMQDRVRFAGKLAYDETLRRIAAADALVQTSIGFETQGMTPFEAASLGTPAVISDPDIADEIGEGVWRVEAPADEQGRIRALAAALSRAAADIAAGTAPVPDPGMPARFRQSSRTAAMVEVYGRVATGR